MNCQKCNFQNEENAKFCRNCGEKLETSKQQSESTFTMKICSKCDSENEESAKFCRKCGISFIDLDTELLNILSENLTQTQYKQANQLYRKKRGRWAWLWSDVYIYTLWAKNFPIASSSLEKRISRMRNYIMIFFMFIWFITLIVGILLYAFNVINEKLDFIMWNVTFATVYLGLLLFVDMVFHIALVRFRLKTWLG